MLFEGQRAGQIVDAHHRKVLRPGPAGETLGVGMVENVLVAVRHHRAAAVPAAPADDVHGSGAEGVGVAHHRADVEVVLPVLHRHVERMAARVQVLHDGLVAPVAIAVDDVAAVTGGQQFGIEAGILRPGLGVRSHAGGLGIAFAGGLGIAFAGGPGIAAVATETARDGRPATRRPGAHRDGTTTQATTQYWQPTATATFRCHTSW